MHLWTAYITIIVTCCWFNFFVKLAHCSYQGTKSPLCQSLHVSHYVRSISLSILIIWGCALNSAHFHPPDWGYSTNPKFHSTNLMCLKARRAFMPSCSAGAHSSFFFFVFFRFFFLHQHNFHSTYQICLPVYFKTKNTIKLKRCCFYTVEDFHYAKQLPKQRCPEWSKNSRSAGSMAGGGYLGFFFG